jgi:hypothetical protein
MRVAEQQSSVVPDAIQKSKVRLTLLHIISRLKTSTKIGVYKKNPSEKPAFTLSALKIIFRFSES